MKVVLAGYNVDTSMLEQAVEAGVPRECLTPEVLSAAYARISRDPRPVFELRQAALDEVEKARSSNRKIIFEMGHHSVAEHAVFNFDVLGISRLAIEWLERFRLCSYTEKSQRYITLDHDFVIPKEIANSEFEAELLSCVTAQAKHYDSLYNALKDRLQDNHPEMAKRKSGKKLLDSWAKEDARYVTLLATTGQLGLTANARNLELMVRRAAASPLSEVKELGRELHNQGSAIAPSLLLFTEISRYDAKTGDDLATLARSHVGQASDTETCSMDAVRLINCTENADRTIAASLLHTFSSASYDQCERAIAGLDPRGLEGVFKTAMRRMEFFDAAAREFEHVTLTFELIISSSAFAQLKRHRMTTQSMQPYDPSLGVTVPPAIEELGLEPQFVAHMERSEALFRKIVKVNPHAAPYVLTNAHRRRVLLTLNLRELYHFARLREDSHAQWDIRRIATSMRRLAEKRIPLGAALMCGKDGYPQRYAKMFDRMPSILPPTE